MSGETKLTILQPPTWPRPRGYANGMMGSGRFVLVAGQVGWDAQGQFAEGFVAQTALALRNILAVLAEAGAGAQHIARLTWYVTSVSTYRASAPALGPVWRDIMDRNFPAMAVVGVSELVEPKALLEIEAT